MARASALKVLGALDMVPARIGTQVIQVRGAAAPRVFELELLVAI